MEPLPERPPLSQEDKEQVGSLLVLYWISTHSPDVHASLLQKDHQHLEPFLKVLDDRGLVEINDSDIYVASESGQQLYQQLLNQQESYVAHFDIYSHVDLEEACFADKDYDLLDDDRWSDLRVAIAEFKGIDPYRMVFLAMLSDDDFFEEPQWTFDLAVGSFFDELEEIVQNQIFEEELGYDDRDGFRVSGKDVLSDVIAQGAEINQEKHQEEIEEAERQMELQRSQQPQTETVTTVEYLDDPGYGYYSPWAAAGSYVASAMFIEALWHRPYW